MAPDEDLLSHAVRQSLLHLRETATNLNDAMGQYSVRAWAHQVNLRFAFCPLCDCDTPTIGTDCGLCGAARQGLLPMLHRARGLAEAVLEDCALPGQADEVCGELSALIAKLQDETSSFS